MWFVTNRQDLANFLTDFSDKKWWRSSVKWMRMSFKIGGVVVKSVVRVTRYATSLISSRDKGRMMRKEGNIDSIANNIKN